MAIKMAAFHLAGNHLGWESIKRNYFLLDKLIPTWLELKEDGSLKLNQNFKEWQFFLALKKKMEIFPLVQNEGLSSRVSNSLLLDHSTWGRAIGNILAYLENWGLGGINLDWEGVKVANKKIFTAFVLELKNSLQKRGYKLGLSIPAKAENNKDSTWSGAYDYWELGQLADELILMAYDYHWAGGPAGPLAPLSWVQDVLDFAIMEVPLEKIYLGIPFYGYDWIVNGEIRARGLSYQQIKALLAKNQLQAEWDQESYSPYFRYQKEGQLHEVWFENRISIREKVRLAQEFNLAGVAFWRLGLEDESVWAELGGQ